MAWIYPVYLSNLNFSEVHIGITSTILNLTVGMTTLYAYRIEQRLQPKATVWLTTLIITLIYITVGFTHSLWCLPLFFVFYFSRGIATPILKDYINRITSSDMRATVLSLRSLLIRTNFAILAPLFGYLTDTYSLNEAFLIIGIIFLILTASSISLFLKSLSQTNVQ